MRISDWSSDVCSSDLRKAKLEARAAQAQTQAAAAYGRARQMGEAILFGQPVLIGHHSEGRDRNYRQRLHNTFGKIFDLQKKAAHYTKKAPSVGDGGISSDHKDKADERRGGKRGVRTCYYRGWPK